MEYFETHIHLDDERFDEDREDVISKMKNEGVTACINMGCDVQTSKKAIKIANTHKFKKRMKTLILFLYEINNLFSYKHKRIKN